MADSSWGAPLWARFVNTQDPRQAGGSDRSQRRTQEAWSLPAGIERMPPPEGAPEGCPLPCDWDRRRYAALDVETTGLDPERDRVIEIGIVLFHFDGEGALVEEKSWGSLVNPGSPIPAASTSIHGITDFDVWTAPAFQELPPELEPLLEGRVMVAHNAPFDASFMLAEYRRANREWPAREMADSLSLLRLSHPHLISFNLGKAAFVLGIETGTSHRAVDDARTCMALFAQAARRISGACP